LENQNLSKEIIEIKQKNKLSSTAESEINIEIIETQKMKIV